MEFLGDVFVKFWKEAIVAVLLTAILPFIRKYVRRRRAMVINFFKERERLKAALCEAEKRAESDRKTREELERKLVAETAEKQKLVDEAENLRVLLEQERKAHDEAERKCQGEEDEKRKFQSEAENLRIALGHEQKAREQAEYTIGAETVERRKAVEEAERLRKELEEERKAREEAERKNQTQAEHLRLALSKPKQEQKPPEAIRVYEHVGSICRFLG